MHVFVLAYLVLTISVSAVPPAPFLPRLCPSMMRSVSHDTSDGSVRLEPATPLPDLRDGDVLIKVHIIAAKTASCSFERSV